MMSTSSSSLRGASLLRTNSAIHHVCRRHATTVLVRAQQDPSVGSKVEKWLQTPFDVLSFGPRATFGALVSLPTKLQTLQQDVEKVVELIQDPRPIDEKQALVLKEIEDNLVEFLDKGATIETDILANIKTVLPPEAAATLSEIIPQPPNAAAWSTVVEPVVVEPEGSSSSNGSGSSAGPPVTYSQSDVFSSQVASEITEIKNAVAGLKSALEDVRTNADVSRVNMLRLKLREARDQLYRRVQEISPTTANDPSVAAATREASILLEEVDAQFF